MKDRSKRNYEDDVLCFWCNKYHEEWPGSDKCYPSDFKNAQRERKKTRQILETFMLEMKYKLTIEYVPNEGWNARPYNTGWTTACYSKLRHVAVRKMVKEIELLKVKQRKQKKECDCY